MRFFNGQGLNLDFNGFNIGLDSQSNSTDLIFLSHAHTDHLIRNPRCPVLTDSLNADLASHRLGKEFDTLSSFPDIELVDSGHVLGGKSLIARADGETFLYTGDFSPHDRFFLKGLRPVKCDSLLIETTYGLPSYNFEPPHELLRHVRDVIEDDLLAGNRVVLWGYALGKAQVLTKLVEGLEFTVDSRIRHINNICRSHGVDLPVASEFSKDFKGIFITPSHKDLTRFSNAKVYSFTGWGSRGVSHCFKLSDHPGFNDLLRFVKDCQPKHVYTHHGFSEEFARFLRVEGFDAKAV